jgi:hypothetical protein
MVATVGSRFLLFVMFSGLALSQQTPTNTGSDGKEAGGYQVQQSIELGYRFVDVVGSQQVYDTYIDLRQGPRVLEQSLSMRSPDHTGVLFDDLFVSSFGWGGDPENAARARITKYRVYDFSAMFRRDYNRFDYPLFANPLNPVGGVPSIPVNFSPHGFDTARRMYDFGLTILPDSKFSVRLGYSRNRTEGSTFSSFHEGTDVLLNQPWNMTSNEYQIGFDFKGLPSTTISYDQFVSSDKNDTDNSLATFATFLLSNGTPVELGLPWNPLSSSPCPVPFIGTAVNPACNGYFSYLRTQRVRTTTPTEQLSITSNYIPRVNLFARASYSSSTMDTPYSEFFNGFVSRTLERQFTFSGPASARRINSMAEVGGTVALTKVIQLNDSFRFDNWRIPGNWNSFATSTTGTDLLSPLGPTTALATNIFNFLSQKSYQNTAQLVFGWKRIGANVGYRFRHRHVFKAEPEELDPEAPLEPFEGDNFDINENGGLAGIWARPLDALRINFDVEIMSADNVITRISPRHRQNYRARANYKPNRWATIGGTANFWESRNSDADIKYRNHYRNAGFVVTLLPNERISLDLAYNYTNSLQNSYICYNGTYLAPGTIPLGCPTYDPAAVADNPNPNWIYSLYENHTHDFNGAVSFSPVKKLRLSVGYGLLMTDGNTTILNPLQPTGTLAFTYIRPRAAASYEVVKNVSLNAYWNYDQYNEDSFVGPTLPRYFHSNRAVLSAKYEF